MNKDPENFGALRKLLALKRLEQPPPGYFDHLAGKIVCRLEMGEGESSFWDRLAASFAVRPALAYGIVLTVCGTLAAATIYSFKIGATLTSSQVASVDAWNSASPALAGQINQTLGLHVLSWPSKANAVADTAPPHSLFQPVNLVALPAGYRTGN
jgi:hypothetical protein